MVFDGWTKLSQFASGLVMVNDGAERGVRLMQEYKDVLTDDEAKENDSTLCRGDKKALSRF